MKRGLLCIFVAYATIAAAQNYPSHSVLATGTWYKMAFDRSGVCRIGSAEIAGLNGVDCSKIAVYGNGGGLMAQRNTNERTNDLRQVAISLHDQNGNGRMDAADYIEFYAEGGDVWVHNAQSGNMEHRRHPYARYNYYYLTTTANAPTKRISNGTAVSNDETEPINTYTSVALLDNDILNTHETGQIWVGEKFSVTAPTRSFSLSLPGVASGTSLRLRAALASVSTSDARFDFAYNSSTHNVTCTESRPYAVFTKNYTASTANPTFNITYIPSESLAAGYLDFIEINATTPLSYRNGQTEMYNLQHIGAGNTAQFSIAGATTATRVWDVSRNDSIVEMHLTQIGTTATFTNTTETVGHYVMFDGNSRITPATVTRLDNQDLHATQGGDLLIVAHPSFVTQAQELADLHLIYDGISTIIVTPEKVYNEFSSGKQDPMAIRELLRMYKKRAEAGDGTTCPRWLLIFGCGTYDNKDLLGNSLPQVLACQSETSFTTEGHSYCTDDLFGYLDDGETGAQNESLEVGIGRLPAHSIAEANHYIDKIRRYMQRSDLADSKIRGDWRNYITLLADDADPSSPGDSVFASSSENLARKINTLFPQFNIDKIYADAYRQLSGAIGSYYPDVNNALRQRMDYGCLLFNYIGHGSVEYIGTERYVEFSDIDNYDNRNQLALFVTSTCSYGRFDKIEQTSGSEYLLNANGGAIGVITATRPIGHIERFDNDLCLGAITPGNTIGDAIRLAKNATSVSHSFVLLGDPALRLSLPENQVVLTEINDRPVVEGECDSAEVLSTVTVKGIIADADGTKLETFNGTLFPTVYDRPTVTQTLANDNDGTEVQFTQQNSILYRGQTPIRAGAFEYSFIVPRDVSSRYAKAKLSHFAKSSDGDCATGYYGELLIGGFDQNADLAECRPEIKLYLNDTTFHNGGMTDEQPTLLAHLSDKVGINAVGSGIGHNITAVLDGNAGNEITLNDFYETDLSDSRRGSVQYGLNKLAPGTHTLTLKAWNIYNYSNSASITFTVRSSDSISVGRCYAYPNPCSDRTTLHIEHNNIDTIETVTVDIMSYTGQIVRRLHPYAAEGSYVITAPWDLRNENGAKVANGIYVARVTIRTKGGERTTTNAKIAVRQ